jgi:hypothetical protein
MRLVHACALFCMAGTPRRYCKRQGYESSELLSLDRDRRISTKQNTREARDEANRGARRLRVWGRLSSRIVRCGSLRHCTEGSNVLL